MSTRKARKEVTRREMLKGVAGVLAAGASLPSLGVVSSSELSSRSRGMLLAAKSFYIGGSNGLPSGCKQVEYITSPDGVNLGYINTGLSLESTNDDLDVTVDIEPLSSSVNAYKIVIGNITGQEGKGKWYAARTYTSYLRVFPTWSTTVWNYKLAYKNDVRYKISLSLDSVKLDDLSILHSGYTQDSYIMNFTEPIDIYLLACPSLNTQTFASKLYGAFAYRNGQKIADMIPVNNNGSAAMFDKVRGIVLTPNKPYALPM